LFLLKHQDEAKKMGKNGREFVREKFLIVSDLRDYLQLFNELL